MHLRHPKVVGVAAATAFTLALLVALAVQLPAGAQDKGTTPAPATGGAPKTLTKINQQLAVGNVNPTRPNRGTVIVDPVVIPRCTLTVIEKQDVPSQRDGVMLFIGTEVKPGEQVPSDRVIRVKMGGQEKLFRELREGEVVEPQQLLAQLDDRLARDDLAISSAKINAAKADHMASEKTRDETYERWQTAIKLRGSGAGAISQEDLRGAKLAYDKYFQEAVSKREAIALAERESNKAQTTLEMHEIRSSIPGQIKMIYRKKGEAIKALEPVLQIQNLNRLRVEGAVDVQYKGFLERGQLVVLEPSVLESPSHAVVGHLQEITGLAVSNSKKDPVVVSSSKDGFVRVWARGARYARRDYRHPVGVNNVTCTGTGTEANLCLTGGEDGIGRIFDLDRDSDQPIRELKGAGRGAINAVAFSHDGALCATAGEDKNIYIWTTATGELKYRQPLQGHRGAVTSIWFTPQGQLVSAAKDRTMRLWTLGSERGEQALELQGRSNNVADLGVSPDGKLAFFDKDKDLNLMALPSGTLTSVVQNPANTSGGFSQFALFSPDGQLALTSTGTGGNLQLWRLPSEKSRGYEIRQWVPRERAEATCAAFSPDGAFAVTGTKDRQIYFWDVPSKEEIEQVITAEITFIDPSVEASARQVRVWAELANPGQKLMPGTTVTMVAYPKK